MIPSINQHSKDLVWNEEVLMKVNQNEKKGEELTKTKSTTSSPAPPSNYSDVSPAQNVLDLKYIW